MFLISEHSSNMDFDINGTLIGIHQGYLYSANSFAEGIEIFRRKVFEPRNWGLVWSCEIHSTCFCPCPNNVAAAYDIIEDELFVAAYGKASSESDFRVHLFSIYLLTSEIIEYKPETNIIGELATTLCNQCCLSSIVSLNPENPSEIAILPWAFENSARFSSSTGNRSDCIQTKISINREAKTCTYLQSSGLLFGGRHPMIPEPEPEPVYIVESNIGVLEFGRIVYFRNGGLYLGQSNGIEIQLVIDEDSDLKECLYAGFYSVFDGTLKCLGFEQNEIENRQTSSLYDVFVDEVNNQAKFTKIHSLSSVRLPSDPRYTKFVMDSRMLVCSYQNQNFTYVHEIPSLKELALIASSNNLGLNPTKIEQLLGLPESFKFDL